MLVYKLLTTRLLYYFERFFLSIMHIYTFVKIIYDLSIYKNLYLNVFCQFFMKISVRKQRIFVPAVGPFISATPICKKP